MAVNVDIPTMQFNAGPVQEADDYQFIEITKYLI